jgi:hypothetical protein
VPITIRENIVSVFLRDFLLSKIAGSLLTDFSDIRKFHYMMLDYSGFDSLKTAKKLVFRNKKQLWAKIQAVVANESLYVFEFGVYKGAGMRWWLKQPMDLIYLGFDTFEGLPEPWIRNGETYLSRNHFSTNGNLPYRSDDQRVTLYKGNVLDKSSDILAGLAKSRDRKRIFLLDFDLLVPTNFVLDLIVENLIEGDIVYFDEGFDSSGEMQIIDRLLSETSNWEILGWTNLACAIIYAPK